ncbi:rhamnogalacturonan lyase family protein [Paenibacillus planticolens]|nr:cohesin domain-containing protein [Paenibacillus planticolens]
MRKMFPLLLSATMACTVFSSAALLPETGHAAPHAYLFDFGTATSPVASGYTRISESTLYTSALGYGLSKVIASRDRGAAYSDILRDFVIDKSFSFNVDMENGDYFVKLTAGDGIATNKTSVTIEGVNRGSTNTASGSFQDITAVVTVADGQMNFDIGGSDGRVNAIEITPAVVMRGVKVDSVSVTPVPSVQLSWDAAQSGSEYSIYRKSEGQSDYVKIATTSGAAYSDTSVELGLTYTYTVTNTSGGYESPKSDPLTVTVADVSGQKPAVPAHFLVSNATENSVSLGWDTVAGASVYYVYRSVSETGTYSKIAATSELSYVDRSVTTNVPYYYKIAAVSTAGLSDLTPFAVSPVKKIFQRQMERLERGLTAIKVSNGVYVGWRLFGTEPSTISFNLYRDGRKINASPITSSTNFLDSEGTLEATYTVRAVIGGIEQTASGSASVMAKNYLDIPLNKPAGGTTPDGVAYTYSANDVSVGDLDGDGQYEYIVKWDPSNSKDNSQSGYTGNVYIDAYELDGTQLWRIDLGKNIRAGAHYTQFMVYDLDGDGKAEVAMKTADGTIDGAGVVLGNGSADYRNSSGYILSGPEYLSIFEGATGKTLTTTSYEPPRGTVGNWGDTYGNRVDRFLAAIAYLDGEHPSLIMARGYYTRSVLVAYNWRDGQLSKVWTFDSDTPGNGGYAGQGNHNLSVADVDGDGKDEIIYGAMAVDHDGKGLYTTGLGHGDAMHLSDLDPDRPGYEVFQVHEEKPSRAGLEFRDARTGELIWGKPTTYDVGRGLSADIDPRYKGAESWAIDAGGWNSTSGGLYDVKGNEISTHIPPANFAIWWDGDLQRELLDHTYNDKTLTGVGNILKWDYENSRVVTLLTAEGTFSNNGTKGNPGLQADLFGDWREEAIWRLEDSSALRIYMTTDVTDYRFYTLMHDPVYRLGVARENTAYNQPPHVGYYLGGGMTMPPMPNITVPAGDAQEAGVTLNGGSTLKPGETISLKYGLTGITEPIIAQNVSFTYDPDYFEYVSVTGLQEGVSVVGNVYSLPGKVRIILASLGTDYGVTGSSELVSLQLRAKAVSSTVDTHVYSSAQVANAEGVETTFQSVSKPITIQYADLSSLNALIGTAETSYAQAVEGIGQGEYPVGSKAALEAAIAKAKAVQANPNVTQAEITQAVAELNAALSAFQASVNTSHAYDVNNSGQVSVGDLAFIAAHYGQTSADPNWNSKADVNADGVVDILDLSAVASYILNE